MHGSWKLADADKVRELGREPEPQNWLDPRRLWSLFLRRWRVILGTAAVVIALAVMWIIQITPIYTATTQILIDPRKERVLGRSEAVVGDLGLDASAIATEVTLIRSFSIARRVVERLKLEQHPAFTPRAPGFSLQATISGAIRSFWPSSNNESEPIQRPSGAETQTISPRTLGLIGAVQSGISVRRVAATYFLEISFEHRDPKVAAQLANAVAEAYLVEQLEARYQAANRAASWLNERASAVRQQLEASERALAEHKAQYNIVGGQAGTIADQQAAAINAQLVAARADTVQKKARFEQAQRILEGGAGIESVASVMDSPVISGLRTQDAMIARTEADLLTRYGPEHPQIVKTRAERADVRRQIRAEVGRVVQTLKTDFEFALQKEKSLEQSIEELTGADARNDGAVIKLRELERQVQSNRLVYDTLLTRFKEAEQQTSLQTAESRVIAPAIAPGFPSYPPKQRFLILALLGGLGIGAAAAFLLEYLENGFTTIEQVESGLQVPVLAMVPQITEKERIIEGRSVPIPEYVALKPLSRFGESIRSARVSAQMSNIDKPPRLIMVTSAIPSEGKTTMVLSLAHSAASSGQRVLLMDCDLRHPSSSKYFNLHEGPGLTDLLTGQAPPERVFLRSSQTNLTILPAGTTTRHPPDVLGSERLRSLMGALRENYDVVFVDAPPLTPVIDAAILSKLADKVIFVVQWRTTPREIVERAIQSVDEPRQKLAGILLNNTQLGLVSSYAPYYSYYHKKYQKYYQQ